MTTDPNDLSSSNQNGIDHTGSAEAGLGTNPAGTDGTVDRVGDTGATSSDNADTPMGSLGGGLSSDSDDR